MNNPAKAWDGEQVRTWLERRLEASKLDQAAADRRGYDAQDEYDEAAAEEWVCRALKSADSTNDQAAFLGSSRNWSARRNIRRRAFMTTRVSTAMFAVTSGNWQR